MATIRRNQTCKFPSPRSHKSKLLNDEENMFVHSLLRTDCTSLATTIVELYQTRPPYHNEWIREHAGVLCFVKNNGCQKYRFYLYSLESKRELWFLPISRDTEYWTEMTFFHMLHGENCIVGFNFADEKEADYLKCAMRIEFPTSEIDSRFVVSSKPIAKAHTMKATRKKLRGKLNISEPLDFVHVAHVNLSSGGSSFNSGKDRYIAEIFKLAGITEEQMRDPDTMKFMENVIKKSRKKQRAPPPPQLPPSPRSPGARKVAPLPPPIPQDVVAPPPPPLPQLSSEDEVCTSFNAPEKSYLPKHAPDFLESIRKGSTLKSVKQRVIPRVDHEDFHKNDIAAALSHAIKIREKALQNNEPYSESDDDFDDDEWDC